MLKIYHNQNCSKSCSALATLKRNNTEFELVDYLEHAPSVEELAAIVEKLHCMPHDLIRTNEAVYIEKFKEKTLTDQQWLVAMHENPILIQRPIVVDENQAFVVRNPEASKRLNDLTTG